MHGTAPHGNNLTDGPTGTPNPEADQERPGATGRCDPPPAKKICQGSQYGEAPFQSDPIFKNRCVTIVCVLQTARGIYEQEQVQAERKPDGRSSEGS